MTAGYDRGLWFSEVFGFRESPTSIYANIEVSQSGRSVVLTSKANSKSYCAGEFSLRTIPSFGKLTEPGGGTLHVIHGYGRRSRDRSMVNVLEIQSRADFDGATFQAASNFNCLEFGSHLQTAFHGVSNYAVDPTQGPVMATATAASTVYRNWFIPWPDGEVGQGHHQVNLLAATPLGTKQVNGKVFIARRDLAALADFDFADPDVYAVGLHENCEVTTVQVGPGTFAPAPPGRVVHHVYAAALNMGTVVRAERVIEIAQQLLVGMYRATVTAAWAMSLKYPDRAGSKRLVLTLLGGGAFHNDPEWIGQAIAAAEDIIVKSGLEVYVVCFGSGEFHDIFPQLKDVVTRTGGSVIDTGEGA